MHWTISPEVSGLYGTTNFPWFFGGRIILLYALQLTLSLKASETWGWGWNTVVKYNSLSSVNFCPLITLLFRSLVSPAAANFPCFLGRDTSALRLAAHTQSHSIRNSGVGLEHCRIRMYRSLVARAYVYLRSSWDPWPHPADNFPWSLKAGYFCSMPCSSQWVSQHPKLGGGAGTLRRSRKCSSLVARMSVHLRSSWAHWSQPPTSSTPDLVSISSSVSSSGGRTHAPRAHRRIRKLDSAFLVCLRLDYWCLEDRIQTWKNELLNGETEQGFVSS